MATTWPSFGDWCSNFQDYFAGTGTKGRLDLKEGAKKIPRTQEQLASFVAGLDHINDWFCNRETTVLVQCHPPEDPELDFAVTLDVAAMEKDVTLEAVHNQLKETSGLRFFDKSVSVENVSAGGKGEAASVQSGFRIVGVALTSRTCITTAKDLVVTLQQLTDAGVETCSVHFGHNQTEMMTPAGHFAVTLNVATMEKHVTLEAIHKQFDDFCGIQFFEESVSVKKVVSWRKEGKEGKWLAGWRAGVPSGSRIVAVVVTTSRTPITTVKDMLETLQHLADDDVDTCTLHFRRNQYDQRGWCAFERRITEMITPAHGMVDLGHLMKVMKTARHDAWLAETRPPASLDEMIIDCYRRSPSTWGEFLYTRGGTLGGRIAGENF